MLLASPLIRMTMALVLIAVRRQQILVTLMVACLLILVAAACGGSEGPTLIPRTSAETDRAALKDLYNSTDGPNWLRNGNWVSDEPINRWFGVTTDDDGRVVGLDLGANEMSGEIPSALGNLDRLQVLDLAESQTSIEMEFDVRASGLDDLVDHMAQQAGDQVNDPSDVVVQRNYLSGCIPDNLRGQLNMELSDLGGLPFCGGPGDVRDDPRASGSSGASDGASGSPSDFHYVLNAAHHGHLAEVDRFIRDGGDVNARDDEHDFPLGEAVKGCWAALMDTRDVGFPRENAKVARLLIDAGADPSAMLPGARNVDINSDGKFDLVEYFDRTPLIVAAAERGCQEVVQVLLDAGADPNAHDLTFGSTPLGGAVREGHAEVARILIDAGADLSEKGFRDQTLLYTAVREGHAVAARILIDAGADPNAKDTSGRTPLHTAVEEGHAEAARILMAAGADMSAQNTFGKTPLHMAIEEGNMEMARILLAAGAEMSAQDRSGDTLLHTAVEEGHAEMTRILVDSGADLNAKGSLDQTPLHMAVEEGNVEIVRILVDSGADLSAKGYQDQTPLHTAVERGNAEITRILLDAGADLSAKGYQDRTPLHTAVKEGNGEITRILLDAGADLSAKGYQDRTPLHTAVNEGNAEITRILLDVGADLSAQDRFGDTPLEEAKSRGNREILEILGKVPGPTPGPTPTATATPASSAGSPPPGAMTLRHDDFGIHTQLKVLGVERGYEGDERSDFWLESGNEWVRITLEVRNMGEDHQTFNSRDLALVDSDHRLLGDAAGAPAVGDSLYYMVADPGETVRGDIVLQAPIGAAPLILRFTIIFFEGYVTLPEDGATP